MKKVGSKIADNTVSAGSYVYDKSKSLGAKIALTGT